MYNTNNRKKKDSAALLQTTQYCCCSQKLFHVQQQQRVCCICTQTVSSQSPQVAKKKGELRSLLRVDTRDDELKTALPSELGGNLDAYNSSSSLHVRSIVWRGFSTTIS